MKLVTINTNIETQVKKNLFDRPDSNKSHYQTAASYYIYSTYFTKNVKSHGNMVWSFQSPPKGATIPYRPKPNVAGPVILAGGQAYTIQGNYAVPAQDVSIHEYLRNIYDI